MTQDDVPSRFAVDFTGAMLLGIYRVKRKVADGGMGSVWLGEDTNLGRKVVVKVPHVRFLGESGFRTRFTREITELVRLEHPNIVRILAQGTHEEIPFFVLQYLGGGSLEDRLKSAGEAPRSMDAVLSWLRTISATLDFVHGRGVVHRDVKPENILFDEEGHVFLSDFGIAKALDENLDVTEAGTGVGSPKYMAPEQGLGRNVEGPADQYGLATTVFEAIAGRLPFEGDSAIEILLNKQNDVPTHLAELAPELPAPCADAVMRGLANAPEERFPSCGEFADAFLAGAGIFDRTPPGGLPPVEAPRRGWVPIAAATALLAAAILLVGFAAGWFSAGKPARESGEEKDSVSVVLLSAGAEPWASLRYRPRPGTTETLAIRISSEESKRQGEEDPVKTSLPTISFRIGLEVTDVAESGDISFAWKIEEMTLEPPDGTPPAVREAMQGAAKVLEGRSGSGRQSDRGINRDLTHDTPPPEHPELQPLFALLTEILAQVSNPLPKEPVGIGACWEVTLVQYHIEGVRFTQTVTFEVESLDENEARLRMFIALTAPHQSFAHPELPADASPRLTRAHGDGRGELRIDFDRIADRSLWMTVDSHAEISFTKDGEEQELSLGRNFRYEAKRE